MKTKFIIIYFLIISTVCANDSFVTGTGKTYAEARNALSKIVHANSLRVVGQNYNKDKNGNWSVTLKVRPR
jgi:hypothetical protein